MRAKIEYKILSIGSLTKVEEDMNKLGEDGWMIGQMTNDFVCMQRLSDEHLKKMKKAQRQAKRQKVSKANLVNMPQFVTKGN